MRLTITGSGGFRRTPRPGCNCPVCNEARELGIQRRGPSMFIHDEHILFDAPEEIASELEDAGIGRIDHLFFTHWHPDHLFGARILEIMNTTWSEKLEWRMVPKHKTMVHMPPEVHHEIMSRLGPFFDFWSYIGIAEVNTIGARAKCGTVTVEPVVLKSTHRTTTHSTIYIIEGGDWKIVYGPCDIIPFPWDQRFHNCDLMILQMGWHGERMAKRAEMGPHCEVSMDQILEVLDKYKPKRTILTHIGDEGELLQSDLDGLESELKEYNITFAQDGMTIDI